MVRVIPVIGVIRSVLAFCVIRGVRAAEVGRACWAVQAVQSGELGSVLSDASRGGSALHRL